MSQVLSHPIPQTSPWRRLSVMVAAVLALAWTMAAGPAASSGRLLGDLAPSGTPAASPAPAVLDPGLPTSGRLPVSVIVQARSGQVATALMAVRAHGGRVGARLEIINGFEAELAPSALRAVAASTAIVAVTANRVGHFDSAPTLKNGVPTASNFVASTGAAKAWSQGDYGQGVGVAVIDTGISPMDDVAGRVVYGPDLSGEGSVFDTFGHGTVMGGLIAGSGADSATNPGGAYTGIAPEATLVAVKVAGVSGAVDVSTMLQAMHWVSAYAAQYNIRVLNLSWGVASTQAPSVDPVDYAVERLWGQGIVVVVAGGNGGPAPSTITKPGDDPVVLTVGAYDDTNNTVPAWSSRGPTLQGVSKPDVVAPGRTLIASRSYGSFVEQQNPSALVAPSYIKGSGTSEATAVTSGAVALLLEARPGLSPDQVKGILKKTASPLAGYSVNDVGSGFLQLAGALTTSTASLAQVRSATGTGSLNASRGGVYVQSLCAGVLTVIQGELDTRCDPWNGAAWAASAWTGDSWQGGSWQGGSWQGGSWQGSDWETGQWDGSSWTGGSWQGASWQGVSWQTSSWTGGSWQGGPWQTASFGPFQTAFWGDHPGPGQHVNGEISPPTLALPFS
ncbi:MAG TPA: S8 family serine peptidase [Acidimicrobiales bacterium]|nr:S8 family serine peptidase [Acidimicrobiales bacterium]